MSEKTEPTVATEIENVETPIAEKAMTTKQIEDLKRNTRNYYRDMIEALKPQVEYMELKARYSKATFDNHRYGMELNKIEAGFAAAEQAAAEENALVKTESTTPVVQMTTSTPTAEAGAVYHQDA